MNTVWYSRCHMDERTGDQSKVTKYHTLGPGGHLLRDLVHDVGEMCGTGSLSRWTRSFSR